MVFTPEILSMVGGAFTGFLFKYMAQAQADRQQQFDNLVKAQQVDDDSADRAAQRANSDSGNWIRRIIVLTILFGVITAPFILALMNKPVAVQVDTPIRTLFGIQYGGHPKFYQLSSYLIIPEVRQALLALIGFYFGQSTAKRS